MIFAFDLISDLHVNTWNDFDWTGQPTAPYCVVAGDVAPDWEQVAETLEHLGQQYAGVFYIDGNDEHRYYLENLDSSYLGLEQAISHVKNVVYMQDNIVIVNGVAILATNGWWSYDLDPKLNPRDSQEWLESYLQISPESAASMASVAYHDAAYMINSVNKLQKQQDVHAIVMVSHTAPAPWLISHDIDLADTVRFNTLGNPHLESALEEDTESKIRAWCFGHYHKPVDRYRNNIRYVSNPRGRGNTPWSQTSYFPKRIEIQY